MVYPRETHGVEGVNLDSSRAYIFYILLAEGEVAVLISYGIEDYSHLYSLGSLSGEEVEHLMADAVVLELEIVQVDILPCLPDVVEEYLKLLLGCRQQLHAALVIELCAKAR